MLREELLHPLLVHFPVALILVAVAVLLVASVWRAPQTKARLFFCWRLLLAIGAITAWAAVFTGDMAEEVVNQTLCDPTATHTHGDLATYVAWIFSGVALLEIVAHYYRSRLIAPLIILLAIIGVGLLVYTAHLGALLVYQQGAAVYRPSAECTEFSD